MKRILGRMIATRFDEGARPEVIALEYMTKAQKPLFVTKKAESLILWSVFRKILKSVKQTEKQEVVELIHGFRQGLTTIRSLLLINKYLPKYNLNDKKINRFVNPVPSEMDLLRQV